MLWVNGVCASLGPGELRGRKANGRAVEEHRTANKHQHVPQPSTMRKERVYGCECAGVCVREEGGDEGRRGGGKEGRREGQNDRDMGNQLVVYGDGEVLCTHFVPLATH